MSLCYFLHITACFANPLPCVCNEWSWRTAHSVWFSKTHALTFFRTLACVFFHWVYCMSRSLSAAVVHPSCDLCSPGLYAWFCPCKDACSGILPQACCMFAGCGTWRGMVVRLQAPLSLWTAVLHPLRMLCGLTRPTVSGMHQFLPRLVTSQFSKPCSRHCLVRTEPVLLYMQVVHVVIVHACLFWEASVLKVALHPCL